MKPVFDCVLLKVELGEILPSGRVFCSLIHIFRRLPRRIQAPPSDPESG